MHEQLYAMKQDGTDSGFCVQDQIAALCSVMQQDMTTQMHRLVMGTLQAAVTPLAEHVAGKLIGFENDLSHIKEPLEIEVKQRAESETYDDNT